MSPVVGHANTHGCSCVFFCMCVYAGTISTTLPLREARPAGGAGHGPAHVQPGLTLSIDPAEGQRGESEEGENGK